MMKDINIHLMNSKLSIITMPPEVDPATFRNPISLILLSVVNSARPNNPMQEMKRDNTETEVTILCVMVSFSYNF